MNSDIIEKNRVLKNVHKLLGQGKRLILLTGKMVEDRFFLDFNHGVLEPCDTIKEYLKSECHITDILHIADQEIVEQPEICKPTTNTNGMDFLKKENDETTADAPPEQPGMQIINAIKNFRNSAHDNNSDVKHALIINHFDWTADFFGDTQEVTSQYFREIKEILSANNIIVFLLQKNTVKFPHFCYDLESDYCITLGKPDTEELYSGFLWQFFNKYSDKRITDLKPINDTMNALSTNNIGLKDLFNIMDKYLDETVVEITADIFKSAISPAIGEKVSEEDVVIDDEIKKRFKSFIEDFLNLEKNDFKKGFILQGPPGTGKTHIARWLANENNCYFMSPKLSDIKGQYIGESVQKVKALFNEARSNAPTIMFIDEIDTVLPQRDSHNSDPFTKDIVNEFLVSIDGAGTQKDRICVIGATNRPNAVDNAIKSRLSEEIEIGLPDKKSRREIFKNNLKGANLIASECWFDEFLERTEGFSGRDIKNVCVELVKKTDLTKMDFYSELGKKETELINELKNNKHSLFVAQFSKDKLKTFDDIIGYPEIKEEINRHVKFCLVANETLKQRVRDLQLLSKGVLLYGPPGTGKSLFAEATAGQYKLHFIKVLSKDIISGSVESTNKNLEMVFRYAYQLSKITGSESAAKGVVLFFDEFDSIAGKDVQNPQIRGTLLDNLTRYRGRADNLIIMAATNYYDIIDDASKREGRFDEHIPIRNLTEAEADANKRILIKKDKDRNLLEFNDSEFVINFKDSDIKDISFADLEKQYRDFKRKIFLTSTRLGD